MWLRQCLVLSCLCLLLGCEKYYLSVKREEVDRESLASTFVGSPDPRQKCPPEGQELSLEWRLPERYLDEELSLVLSVVYKNFERETICYPIARRRGVVTYSLLNEKYRESGGLLTYKAEVVGKDGAIIKGWKQQLWADLIVIDDVEIGSLDQ